MQKKKTDDTVYSVYVVITDHIHVHITNLVAQYSTLLLQPVAMDWSDGFNKALQEDGTVHCCNAEV